jgi:hypothetical protein
MLYALIQSAIGFVESNAVVIGMIMAITAYFKIFMGMFAWSKAWMITAFAFFLAFLFAIPAWPFSPDIYYILNAFLMGLAATGIYKTGAALAEKAHDL